MRKCWKDELEHAEETYGYCSAEWVEVYTRGGGTCMLLDGHTSPHVFTPDDQIVIEFK